ncbi:GNAT family N-acetyltransferase [Gordonia sp. CPCC 205515]|uniref:GNAT family N-acetyltransferase n=1 Tax=Gordonia sp. CPCC 205515 TaxID=3140791 RepID=UPI003AF3F7E0
MTGRGQFTIRDGVADDARAVSEVRSDVAAEGRWLGTEPPVDIDRSMQAYLEVLADESSHTVVAVDDSGSVIGSISMFTVLPGVTTFGMWVVREQRRRGVGSALVSAVLAWSRDRGAHKVILEVWPHNEAAIALYTAHGFVREGLRPKHYRRRNGDLWDVVEMGLVLSD